MCTTSTRCSVIKYDLNLELRWTARATRFQCLLLQVLVRDFPLLSNKLLIVQISVQTGDWMVAMVGSIRNRQESATQIEIQAQASYYLYSLHLQRFFVFWLMRFVMNRSIIASWAWFLKSLKMNDASTIYRKGRRKLINFSSILLQSRSWSRSQSCNFLSTCSRPVRGRKSLYSTLNRVFENAMKKSNCCGDLNMQELNILCLCQWIRSELDSETIRFSDSSLLLLRMYVHSYAVSLDSWLSYEIEAHLRK